jgi:hypothetical protein
MNLLHRWELFLVAAGFTLVLSCKKTDGFNTPAPGDNSKPDVVTGVKVVNFSGGATITYSLPAKSDNILYVQANYKINGQTTRQVKSSYYSDSLTVSGFASSQDYQVTLYTVSRTQVKSDPVTVTVHPSTPPYLLASPSIRIRADFGGVNISVANPAKANIGIVTISPDATTKKLEVINQNYTDQDSVSFSLRGYDTIPRQFGVYITDEWGNISDTVLATIKPVYEVLMNKSLFKEYDLGSDVGTSFGWVMPYMWDGNTGSPGYHSTYPTTVPLPKWITFDMGQAAKLSRYTVWYRGLDGSYDFLWTSGAPQTWVLWGRPDGPVDEVLPDSSHLPAVGQATPGGWINLGLFHLPPQPSGLANPQYTNADLSFWNAGFSFGLPFSVSKVRYMRFECMTNAGGSDDFFNIMEISLYGDPR